MCSECSRDGIGGRLSQIRAQSGPDIIPYEVIKPKSGNTSYELRFYQPRFIVEMPYKSRSTAYIAFDKYLTGDVQRKEGLTCLELPFPLICI